jgi:superfamily II DNA helicase RecQ
MNYESKIKSLKNISFDTIRSIAINEISHLSRNEKDVLWNGLRRGTALLDSHEHLCMYLFSFGNMHQAKLLDAFQKIPLNDLKDEIDIVDWGCGQAIGTIVLLDFLKAKGINLNIRKITLIEPALEALNRAKIHVKAFVENTTDVVCVSEYFQNITPQTIESKANTKVIHIFSNILDVVQIDLKKLANLIDSTVISDNLLVCVGPLNPTNQRIDAFFRYFDKDLITNLYEFESSNFQEKNWTYKSRIYRLENNNIGHLIPIKYFPTVQFHAAFELDVFKEYRKRNSIPFSDNLSSFEVAAPFDLGANVYDDVHPVLAVLNNIICRGLPTKSSVFIEEKFSNAFDLTERIVEYGEVKFTMKSNFDFVGIHQLFSDIIDKEYKFTEEELLKIQLLLSPIAISRFQKVLLEAIITEHISMELDYWNILVEEKDVPYAYIAINDFKQLFSHLVGLAEEFNEFKLPEIKLTIISNENFIKSKLQSKEVYLEPTKEINATEFDLVISQEMLKSVSTEIELFSKYKVKNNCYFNIRSSITKRTNRVVYTSSLIEYKNLVQKTNQGVYNENLAEKAHLTYFLQLFFRKESFRPGQLPILDRALQNLPVIGLLPTGGGKSLTYQISALLQPGITMIIDPLKSLMKDQFDGLINSGIDYAAYLNSTQHKKEKEHIEKQLESSQLLFIFLSPERLSIASFRERLKNMHDYNVYFSYGVIDEVHCVSEWGHDFRFSYLHLGRNLYNYVRAKHKEISLFGLTATASFDVLADVERELSGNGAFALDADVIVRYENTNRLELQYKIEKVPVQFDIDNNFDTLNKLDANLPKALNISNFANGRATHDSKKTFLENYVKKIPVYLNELQKPKSIKLIKDRFIERQNNSEGTDTSILVNISEDYYTKKSDYVNAGIIFCPHVNKTGISVNSNKTQLQEAGIIDVASFSGQDDDNESMNNLELFRNNKSPLMVATKAFGMGIDKPNVRFTINMNYSSSLESFVQEAGRAGRDRNIALSTILVSDYELAQISRNYSATSFPLGLIKGRWFYKQDLTQILKHYNLTVPENEILLASPVKDIVKLFCTKDNRMFAFNQCNDECSEFTKCTLKNTVAETRTWKPEIELIQELESLNFKIGKKNFQYLNIDYQTVMFFFNSSFKGDIIEKTFMNKLLSSSKVFIGDGFNIKDTQSELGFLTHLLKTESKSKTVIFVPYTDEDNTDLSKAIYRMTCIDLIQDFTQDYKNNLFRIVVVKKENGGYYLGLKNFLLRYYTEERALLEIEKVKKIVLKNLDLDELAIEIYRCLAYLTEFVYDKISEKRKRAIDDMRNFCIEGLSEKVSWIENNENLKDYIYYYFNSKYAKSDYVADNGEQFSLVEDTEGGKISSKKILHKYMRVIEDEIVGVGTPLDNVKHLYGAVRLISRSLTDSNPALFLLEVFCLVYMGTKKNKNLEEQLVLRYSEGMIEFSKRIENNIEFWELFDEYNEIIKGYFTKKKVIKTLIEETSLLIHANNFQTIKNKYLEIYE